MPKRGYEASDDEDDLYETGTFDFREVWKITNAVIIGNNGESMELLKKGLDQSKRNRGEGTKESEILSTISPMNKDFENLLKLLELECSIIYDPELKPPMDKQKIWKIPSKFTTEALEAKSSFVEALVENNLNWEKTEFSKITNLVMSKNNFKCKVCNLTFKSLLQHLKKYEPCNQQYSKVEREDIKSVAAIMSCSRAENYKEENKERIRAKQAENYQKNKTEILKKKKAEREKIKTAEKAEQTKKNLEEWKEAIQDHEDRFKKQLYLEKKYIKETRLGEIDRLLQMCLDEKTTIVPELKYSCQFSHETIELNKAKMIEILQGLPTKIDDLVQEFELEIMNRRKKADDLEFIDKKTNYESYIRRIQTLNQIYQFTTTSIFTKIHHHRIYKWYTLQLNIDLTMKKFSELLRTSFPTFELFENFIVKEDAPWGTWAVVNTPNKPKATTKKHSGMKSSKVVEDDSSDSEGSGDQEDPEMSD